MTWFQCSNFLRPQDNMSTIMTRDDVLWSLNWRGRWQQENYVAVSDTVSDQTSLISMWPTQCHQLQLWAWSHNDSIVWDGYLAWKWKMVHVGHEISRWNSSHMLDLPFRPHALQTGESMLLLQQRIVLGPCLLCFENWDMGGVKESVYAWNHISMELFNAVKLRYQ